MARGATPDFFTERLLYCRLANIFTFSLLPLVIPIVYLVAFLPSSAQAANASSFQPSPLSSAGQVLEFHLNHLPSDAHNVH